jgi:hypothetical protein
MLVSSSSPLSPELQFRNRDDRPIVIGLVNNMPDAALRTTEAPCFPPHLALFPFP